MTYNDEVAGMLHAEADRWEAAAASAPNVYQRNSHLKRARSVRARARAIEGRGTARDVPATLIADEEQS